MAQPDYRIASLDHEDLKAIEHLERRLGLTLIAWEPAGAERRAPQDAVPPEAELMGDPSEPLL